MTLAAEWMTAYAPSKALSNESALLKSPVTSVRRSAALGISTRFGGTMLCLQVGSGLTLEEGCLGFVVGVTDGASNLVPVCLQKLLDKMAAQEAIGARNNDDWSYEWTQFGRIETMSLSLEPELAILRSQL